MGNREGMFVKGSIKNGVSDEGRKEKGSFGFKLVLDFIMIE